MEKTIVGLADAVEAFLLSCRGKGCTGLEWTVEPLKACGIK